MIVSKQISLAEQRLRNHHYLVSRLSENKDQAAHQEGGSTFDDTQSFVPFPAALSPEALAEDKSPSHRDPPTIPTPTQYASKFGSAQSVPEATNDQTLSEDAVVDDSIERDESWPSSDARAGFRLHKADFIQNLSK